MIGILFYAPIANDDYYIPPHPHKPKKYSPFQHEICFAESASHNFSNLTKQDSYNLNLNLSIQLYPH
jgi:hypothetical protein